MLLPSPFGNAVSLFFKRLKPQLPPTVVLGPTLYVSWTYPPSDDRVSVEMAAVPAFSPPENSSVVPSPLPMYPFTTIDRSDILARIPAVPPIELMDWPPDAESDVDCQSPPTQNM